jgi:hypothetical protein
MSTLTVEADAEDEAPYVPDVHDYEAAYIEENGFNFPMYAEPEDRDYEPLFTYHPCA